MSQIHLGDPLTYFEAPQAPKIKSLVLSHLHICSASRNERVHLVIEDGKISDILSSQVQPPESGFIVDASSYVCYPGLINSHTHSPMTFLRDLAHNQDAMITNIFFRREKDLTPEVIEPFSYPYLLSGLKKGVTCFVDHYYFSKEVGHALQRLGLKGCIGETIADQGGAFPSGAKWQETQDFIENWPYGSDISPTVCPHAADTVSTALMKNMAHWARSRDLPLHFHLSQTQSEYDFCQKEYGKSPVEWAADCGALGPQSLAVHLVSAQATDIDRLKENEVTVGFCPSSQILYEKLAPLAEMANKGVKLSIGTDCAASQDTADLLSEMKLAHLLGQDRNVSDWSELEILKSVTTHPAETLARPELGQIESGLPADLIFIKKTLLNRPLTNPYVNLLYSSSASSVEHVMINGRWTLWQGQPVLISESDMENAFLAALELFRQKTAPTQD